MAKKLTKTEEIIPLKYNKDSVFYKMKHWQVRDDKLELIAGGIWYEEDYETVYKYFKDKGVI